MWFGDKALRLKATVADVIHYCQLGKLAVMRHINNLRFFLPETQPTKIGRFLTSRIWKPLTETQRKVPGNLIYLMLDIHDAGLSIRRRQSRKLDPVPFL